MIAATTDPTVTIDGAPAPAAFAAHVVAQEDRRKALRGCPGCVSVFDYPHGPTCTLPAALRGATGRIEVP